MCLLQPWATTWGLMTHIKMMETMFIVPNGESTWSSGLHPSQGPRHPGGASDCTEQRQIITLHSSKFLTHRPLRSINLIRFVDIFVQAIEITTVCVSPTTFLLGSWVRIWILLIIIGGRGGRGRSSQGGSYYFTPLNLMLLGLFPKVTSMSL